MRMIPRLALAAVWLALSACMAPAQPAPPGAGKQQAIADERKAAGEAADKATQAGPAEIALLDQGVIALPAGMSFVPRAESMRWMRANGNDPSDATVGIFTSSGDGGWWALLEFIKAGYVKDEDAKNWNADELLANIQQGTEAANADRVERGFPALEVPGWIEKPAYFEDGHRLIWSALVRRKGEAGRGGSVNYNTYALGREGYFSLDLITGEADIGVDKARARELLEAIRFAPGKAYGDFVAATDHIAEYGLAALVGGVVAKKLGLFALAAVFVLKFAKIIGLAVLGVGAAAARLFGRRKPKA